MAGPTDYIRRGELVLILSQLQMLPTWHKFTHEVDGDDELNVEGLSGVLADGQKSDLPYARVMMLGMGQ